MRKILTGHTSPETAYVVEDYPYGFRLRCKCRFWVEFKKGKGYRLCSQTTNPKVAGEVWNKPKASTYSPLGLMYLDEQGYVQNGGIHMGGDVKAFAAFIKAGYALQSDSDKEEWARIATMDIAMDYRGWRKWFMWDAREDDVSALPERCQRHLARAMLCRKKEELDDVTAITELARLHSIFRTAKVEPSAANIVGRPMFLDNNREPVTGHLRCVINMGTEKMPLGGKWSGKGHLPEIGDSVDVALNSLGRGIVHAYHIKDSFVGLQVFICEPPEWHAKQNPLQIGVVFGSELRQ